jgi:hypothetical protein
MTMTWAAAFAAALGAAALTGAAGAAENEACSYRQSVPKAAGEQFVNRGNWLAPEHLRIGQQAALRFMPAVVMRAPARGGTLAKSATLIDPEHVGAIDPDDGQTKALKQLLDARLYVDGIIVVKAEQVVLENFRPGFSPAAPRLLLQASRPILASLLATASDRGKLSREKSVANLLPDLARQSNLRKTSVQRLLDARTGLTWSVEDRRQWLAATGWGAAPAPASAGVRAWLRSRKSWPRDGGLPVSEAGAPEGELLLWTLESAAKRPVSRVACESLLSMIGAEDEAYWLTDGAGTELGDGLALSLRDFARFGMALAAARSKPGSAAIAPRWLVETLAAKVRGDDPLPESLRGLGEDADWRYRFASLGSAHQAAIVGPFGNSLLVDFDRKLVIAIYASFPRDYSPLMLQTLRSVWNAIDAAAGREDN